MNVYRYSVTCTVWMLQRLHGCLFITGRFTPAFPLSQLYKMIRIRLHERCYTYVSGLAHATDNTAHKWVAFTAGLLQAHQRQDKENARTADNYLLVSILLLIRCFFFFFFSSFLAQHNKSAGLSSLTPHAWDTRIRVPAHALTHAWLFDRVSHASVNACMNSCKLMCCKVSCDSSRGARLSCCCGELIFFGETGSGSCMRSLWFLWWLLSFFVATVDLASTIVRTHIAYMYKTCTCTHMHSIMRCAKPRCTGRSSTEVCVLQDAEEQEQ